MCTLYSRPSENALALRPLDRQAATRCSHIFMSVMPAILRADSRLRKDGIHAAATLQPPPVAGAHGGWQLVFDWLRRERYREALLFNDLVVIHVDTDVCEEPDFAVSRREGGRVLAPDELVARVAAKLVSLIDPAFLALHADKFVFAIAVDEMECWLLPLLLDNDKAEKTTGCLAAANYELRRQKRDGLSSGETKFQRAYEKVARDFRKRKAVAAARKRSASLDAFVVDLERKCGLVLVAPTAD